MRSSACPSSRTCLGTGEFVSTWLERNALDGLDHAGAVLEDRAVDAAAVVGDRRVRACHVERADGSRPEADREVRREVAANPEAVGGLDDRLRADDVRQLRVDGVVGGDDRAREAHAAEVRVVVVGHLPDPVAGVDRDRLRLELRHGRDALVHRRREDDRLERRAGLPPRLRGEVELALPEVPPAEHRLHGAGREDRSRREPRPGRRGCRRTFSIAARGLQLELHVDRRRDLQPAAEHPPGSVVRDELVLHVVDEVRRRPLRAREPDVLGHGKLGLVGAPVLAPGDLPLLEHHREHVPPPEDRAARVRGGVVERRIRRNARPAAPTRTASAPWRSS